MSGWYWQRWCIDRHTWLTLIKIIYCLTCLTLTDVADEADKHQKTLLTADTGCQYDSNIEINLDKVIFFTMCACMFLCVCLCFCACVRACVRACVCVCACAHPCECSCVHICACMRAYQCATFSEFFLCMICTIKNTINHKVTSFLHPSSTLALHL